MGRIVLLIYDPYSNFVSFLSNVLESIFPWYSPESQIMFSCLVSLASFHADPFINFRLYDIDMVDERGWSFYGMLLSLGLPDVYSGLASVLPECYLRDAMNFSGCHFQRHTVSICPSLVLLTCPHHFVGWQLHYFPGQQDEPVSSCPFPSPALESATSLRTPGLF